MSTLYIFNWHDNEKNARRVFSWLARIQAGRKFGSLPIGWYQMHQCACLAILEPLAGPNPVRCKFGQIQSKAAGAGAKWRTLISAIELFQQADNQVRK